MTFMLIFIVLISGQLLITSTVFASVIDIEKPIKIGCYLTPGLIKEDGTGMFNKLTKTI